MGRLAIRLQKLADRGILLIGDRIDSRAHDFTSRFPNPKTRKIAVRLVRDIHSAASW